MKALSVFNFLKIAPLAALLVLFSVLAVVPSATYAESGEDGKGEKVVPEEKTDDGGGAGTLPGEPGSIKTPLGDIPTDPTGFAQWILNWGIGLGALLATLILIIGGFGVATSSGDPDNLQRAKAQITAAIAGLLFILMSVLILNIIGGEIIGIDFFKR